MTSSKAVNAKHPYKYKLRFVPEALDEWRALDGSVKANLKKLLEKRLNNPHVPGGELHGPLAGCDQIQLRPQGARLVYSVEDDHLLVTVVAVDRREDGVVYQSAMARLSETAEALAKALRDKLKK
ncbi:MAG: type II toxin-antitoxin system RelE family toxin [Rubrivivax sp.]